MHFDRAYNRDVDSATQDALAAIDRAVEWVRRRREEGWPPLSAAYLAHIEEVERMPQNQPGADKTARAHAGRGRWQMAARDAATRQER